VARPQSIPTVEQLRELPLQLQMKVPSEWEDRNGHVGVKHFLELYQLGAWYVLHEIGVDEAWFKQHQFSQFDLEHHAHYLSEIRVGDSVSTYNRVVGKGVRRFHGVYFIINDTLNRLACIQEYVTASIDMRIRSAAPFPDELSRGLDRLLASHQALSWPAPLCGSLSS
jgi:acyl-CoA thioesterase FadM